MEKLEDKFNIIGISGVQMRHLESLLWLLDPVSHIAEGRTHLMAVAYLEIAARHPGLKVQIVDHSGHRAAIQFVVREMEGIISRMPRSIQERYTISKVGLYIVYKDK